MVVGPTTPNINVLDRNEAISFSLRENGAL
jgi:hypothetical protein